MTGDTLDAPAPARPVLPEGDYVSPNLEVILPDPAFPHLMRGNALDSTWPYLRREIPHNWYVDSRNPTVGFANRDEAAILYNTARLFHGRPCLEIGCWRGWSTVHLALGSGSLDVIDPMLADPVFANDVKASCARAGVLDCISFHSGTSPAAVEEVAKRSAKHWSLAFIDGDHEGPAPRLDAEAVARHAATNALVLFHDLVSPDVAAGLDYFRAQGWNTRLYQTMQIMGVAWRGDVRPVEHQPDSHVEWTLPAHLAEYDAIGWAAGRQAHLVHFPFVPVPGQAEAELVRERDEAVSRAVSSERPFAELERDFAALVARLPDLTEAVRENEAVKIGLGLAQGRIRHLEQALAASEHDSQRAAELERDFAALVARLPDLAEAVQRTDLLQIQLGSAQEREAQLEEALAAAATQRSDLSAERTRANQFKAERDAARSRTVAAEASLRELLDRLPSISFTLDSMRAELRSALGQAAEVNQMYGERLAAIAAMARFLSANRVLVGLLRRPGLTRIAITRQHAEQLGLHGLISPEVGSWLCKRRMLLGLLRRSRSSRTSIVAMLLRDADLICLAHARAAAQDRMERAISESELPAARVYAPGGQVSALDQQAREIAALQRRLAALEEAKAADEAALLEMRIELAILRAGRSLAATGAAHG